MKKKIISIFILFLLLPACGMEKARENGAPEEMPSGVAEYFPFADNIHMIYRGEGNEFAEFETYVEYRNNGAIQIRTRNPGTETISVYTVENGALKRVYQAGETYYRLDQTALRDTEEILIREPIRVGTEWTLEDGAKRSITSVGAKVEVPAGTFEALEITTEGIDYTLKQYYAPGIGLIGREFSSGDEASGKITSELERMEKGVPLTQTVRFYFPDFRNDRLVYMGRDADLYTGDNILTVLEAGMKEVPEDSGLIPLLSEKASIVSLAYDGETSVVRADFSAEFVTDMTAGSTLEKMLLSGVADTLGYYFQTDKAEITMEGNPYGSGHFEMEEGEYWTADWADIPAYEPPK